MASILRFTLGLAAYFATLYVGVLITTALHPELSEQDPGFMYLVLVFPGGILHAMLVILLARVANHPYWWPSLLLAALSAAVFVGLWYSYSV
jgi:hypothetical protein